MKNYISDSFSSMGANLISVNIQGRGTSRTVAVDDMISADQTDPAKEDEPEIAAEPENRSAYDIRADQPAEAEEPGVQLMGAPAAVQPAAPAAAPRSIFMVLLCQSTVSALAGCRPDQLLFQLRCQH